MKQPGWKLLLIALLLGLVTGDFVAEPSVGPAGKEGSDQVRVPSVHTAQTVSGGSGHGGTTAVLSN